jgi:hypothetical protein
VKKMNELEEKYSYCPTKLEYEQTDFESPGSYHMGTGFRGVTENIAYLEAASLAFNDMERLIKKNFKLSQEKVDKFNDQNPIQITLREEIEKIMQEMNELKKRYQQLEHTSAASRDPNDHSNVIETQNELERVK